MNISKNGCILYIGLFIFLIMFIIGIFLLGMNVRQYILWRASTVNISIPLSACNSQNTKANVICELGLPHGKYCLSLFYPYVPKGNQYDEISLAIDIRISIDNENIINERKNITLTSAELDGIFNSQNIDFPKQSTNCIGWPLLSYPWDAMQLAKKEGVLIYLVPNLRSKKPKQNFDIDITLETKDININNMSLRIDSNYEM